MEISIRILHNVRRSAPIGSDKRLGFIFRLSRANRKLSFFTLQTNKDRDAHNREISLCCCCCWRTHFDTSSFCDHFNVSLSRIIIIQVQINCQRHCFRSMFRVTTWENARTLAQRPMRGDNFHGNESPRPPVDLRLTSKIVRTFTHCMRAYSHWWAVFMRRSRPSSRDKEKRGSPAPNWFLFHSPKQQARAVQRNPSG